MRGSRAIERNGAYFLQDPVYIIDGLQRVSAGLHRMQVRPDASTRLGATIYFDTTEEWERMRFRILNVDRVKLSSNIILRNASHDARAIRALLDLTGQRAFVLHNRVCWEQRMTKQQLLTAVTFTKVAGILHSHAGPGRSTQVDQMIQGLEKIHQSIGPRVFRDNVTTFFDLIDECWGVKRVTFKEGALHMRGTFLFALADVLSGHTDFWKGDRLFIAAPMKRKLASFPLTDPSVAQLVGSSGKAREVLVFLLIKHINSGRRTGHLTPRGVTEFDIPEEYQGVLDEAGDEEAVAC